MKQGFLIGIDNGGTFSKAAVFDETGKQLAVSGFPTETIMPEPGYTERDMNMLWKVNAQAIHDVIDKSGIDPVQIRAVSVAGHGKGLYLVDSEGTPAYNGILSTDERAWKYVKAWEESGIAKQVYQRTFQKIFAYQPVSLLAWMKDFHPEIIEKTKYIFAVKDYIRYCLTGEAFAEYSDFSGGNLINLESGTYDKELLGLFGLEDIFEKLPPLRKSYEICGKVTHDASIMTGIPEGTPVAAGMFDVDACGIATGLSSGKEMCMIAGTWSINEYISKQPIKDGSVSLNSMFCIPEYYLVEESSPTSAGNLEWFIRNLMADEANRAKAENKSVYTIANNWVESIEPQEFSLFFLPFLYGSNEDALAKGTFIGLTGYHTKKHMLRAVYEGVVFSHMTHVKRLLVNREQPESIRLSGGAANSEVWVQMFADALQIPVDVVEDKELGSQGAAMAAGVSVGIYSDYQDAINKSVRISKRVYPRQEYRDIYEEKYTIYREILKCLEPAWGLLS